VWLSSRSATQTPNNQEALLKFSRSWNATTCARLQRFLATNEASVSSTCVLKPRFAPPQAPNRRRRRVACYHELRRTLLMRRCWSGVRGHKRAHGIGRSGEDLGHWGGAERRAGAP
jgi:hypothetical protein